MDSAQRFATCPDCGFWLVVKTLQTGYSGRVIVRLRLLEQYQAVRLFLFSETFAMFSKH